MILVGSPSQIGNLGDELRLDPMHAGEHERRSEARAGGGRSDAQRRRPAGQWIEAAPEIGKEPCPPCTVFLLKHLGDRRAAGTDVT